MALLTLVKESRVKGFLASLTLVKEEPEEQREDPPSMHKRDSRACRLQKSYSQVVVANDNKNDSKIVMNK